MKKIRITSRRDGFRRAGIAHPATPTVHAAEKFGHEQLEQLRNEPMLIIEELSDTDTSAAEGGKAEGTAEAQAGGDKSPPAKPKASSERAK